jgi:hypothetical protein
VNKSNSSVKKSNFSVKKILFFTLASMKKSRFDKEMMLLILTSRCPYPFVDRRKAKSFKLVLYTSSTLLLSGSTEREK